MRTEAKRKDKKKTMPVTRWTVPDDAKITVLVPENPKSPMSPSSKRFELYLKVGTVGKYRELMKRAGTPHYANLDLARDRDRGYIKF